jgi:hypothetical protein
MKIIGEIFPLTPLLGSSLPCWSTGLITQFLDLSQAVGRVSSSQDLYLNTGQHKHRKTRTHIEHPCPGRDSNPISSIFCFQFLRIVGFEVLTAMFMKITVFWDITPHSPLNVSWSFGGTYRLHIPVRVSRTKYYRDSIPPAFTLVSCSTYSTLKMEGICSSETLVDFQRTMRPHIPEDSTLESDSQ